jgi:hypothetical protein
MLFLRLFKWLIKLPSRVYWTFKLLPVVQILPSFPQVIYWKLQGQGFYILTRRKFREYGWSLTNKSVNWGDLLLREIADEFFDIPALRREYSGAIFGGSVLSEVYFQNFQERVSSKSVLAVSCGARNSRESLSPPPNLEIHGVRGLGTASLIERSNPTGDPGMLAPVLFGIEPRIGSRFRKLVVPHYSQTFDGISSDYEIISPMLPFGKSSKSIVREINDFNFVMAGSLHAGICAFATGTPFAFSLRDSSEDPFKFYDFASFFGIEITFHEDFESAMRWYVSEESMHVPRLPDDFDIYPSSLSRFFKFDQSIFHKKREIHTESRNRVHALKVESLRDFLGTIN